MIGQLRCSRIRRQSSNPSMPGMFTSSKARSIPACSSVKLRLTARSASSAFCAHTVSYPSMRKNSSSICTIESSSSTISSRCSGPIPINPMSDPIHPWRDTALPRYSLSSCQVNVDNPSTIPMFFRRKHARGQRCAQLDRLYKEDEPTKPRRSAGAGQAYRRK